MLMLMLSAWISGGWQASCSASAVLLMTSASSSNAATTCCCSVASSTVLGAAMLVNAIDRVASMIAPANANPNDRPNDPAAELTTAASLTLSSEIGASV